MKYGSRKVNTYFGTYDELFIIIIIILDYRHNHLISDF